LLKCWFDQAGSSVTTNTRTARSSWEAATRINATASSV
jgi:hypothetical protein